MQVISNITLAAEGQGYRTVGSPSINTSIKHSGDASLECHAAGDYAQWAHNFVRNRDYFLRMYIYLSSEAMGAATTLFRAHNANTVSVRIGAGRNIQLRTGTNGGTLLGSSEAISTNAWHRVEVMWNHNTTGSNSTVSLRVDGIEVVAPTTSDLGSTDFTLIQVGAIAGNHGLSDFLIDDVILNDDDNVDPQSWPGYSKIGLLKPIGDTNRVGWTAGAGGTTNLYQAVDNIPADDGVAIGSATNTSQIKTVAGAVNDAYEATMELWGTYIRNVDLVKHIDAVAQIGNSTTTTRHLGLILSNPTITETNIPTYNAVAVDTFPTGWVTNRVGIHNTNGHSLSFVSFPTVRVERTVTNDDQTVSFLGIYFEWIPILGQAEETDTALSITPKKSAALGQVTELDTANAITPEKDGTLNQASETDSAEKIVSTRFITISQASESDECFSLDGEKDGLISQVSETDFAQALIVQHSVALNQVSEIDDVHSFTGKKDDDLNQASDSGTALAFTVKKELVLGQASEDEIPQSFNAIKNRVLEQVEETDSNQAVGVIKQKIIGLAAEDNESLSITSADEITHAQEIDEALSIRPTKLIPIGQVSDSNTTQSITVNKQISIGQADEVDTVQSIQPKKTLLFGQAVEIEDTQSFTPTHRITIGQVTENNSSGSFTPTKQKLIGIVVDAQQSQPFTGNKELEFSQISELDQALSLVHERQINRVIETDTALPFTAVTSGINIDLNMVFETDSVIRLENAPDVTVVMSLQKKLSGPSSRAKGSVESKPKASTTSNPKVVI